MSTFVYDGDCAFCTACARLIIRWIPTSARVVPWQFTDLGALGLDRARCQEAVQWVPAGPDKVKAGPDKVKAGPDKVKAGPAAIAALLRSSDRGAWRAIGWALDTRPALRPAGPIYRWVARHRHQLPGGTAACAMPPPAPKTDYAP